ncbi:MAG: hypothetical protein PWP23_2022 [Candidatus Sumerlaeota bacterium]|nr:hypothetical protein [Candidatus Sumerlaeota bacterium]
MAKQPAAGKPAGASSPAIGKTPAKSGEQQKKTEFVKYTADVARKGGRKLFSYAVWVFVIVGLAWGGYMLFLKQDQRIGERGTPDSVVESYTTFVLPYVPPASLSPSQDTVNQWLGYFDDASQDWFNDNIDKLSFLSVRSNSAEWTEMPAGKRKMEAMQFMLSRGALTGGAVIHQEHEPDSDVAVVTFTTGKNTYKVTMRKDGNTWEMQNFMDMIPVIGPMLENVHPPGT